MSEHLLEDAQLTNSDLTRTTGWTFFRKHFSAYTCATRTRSHPDAVGSDSLPLPSWCPCRLLAWIIFSSTARATDLQPQSFHSNPCKSPPTPRLARQQAELQCLYPSEQSGGRVALGQSVQHMGFRGQLGRLMQLPTEVFVACANITELHRFAFGT